jgi:hypothetical protein
MFPAYEREFVCPECACEWEQRVRYVRASEDDPFDLDIAPEPLCPECMTTGEEVA